MTRDQQAVGLDLAVVAAEQRGREPAKWGVRWRLEKRHGDAGDLGLGLEEFLAREAPYEVIEGEGNLLVNAGIQLMLDKLIGAAGTVFDNTNAYIGVGDSTTAAAAAQTDLQAATNKIRVGMDATYPNRSGQTMTWRTTYGSGQANFHWQEWAIFNAAAAGTMLNRKVEDLGTKASGSWTLAVSVTIS